MHCSDLRMPVKVTVQSELITPLTYRLTDTDAVDVWRRHWNGEYQHNIAAVYGVNSARINDVLKKRTHLGSKMVAAEERND
jgi:hypothetical protein